MDTRCEADIARRDPNRLPPNVDIERCAREAAGQYVGKMLCAYHIRVRKAAHDRGLARYRDRLGHAHNVGHHTDPNDWPACNFCHPNPNDVTRLIK